MLLAILFALTALVTGFHNIYRVMYVVNGAPIPLLNCIALLGSVVLLVAAASVPFRPRAGAKTGLVGSILSWIFYLPMTVVYFFTPVSAWQEVRFLVSFRDYVPVAGMILGPILLVACTVAGIRTIRARSR